MIVTELHESSAGDVPEPSTVLNIAALPSPAVGDVVRTMSSDLCDRGGMFAVDDKPRRAHLTLYMARFPDAEIAVLRDLAAKAVDGAGRIAAEHVGFHVTPGNYYEISYARSADLLGLHLHLMETLSVLRYSPGRPVVEEYFGPYSPAQREKAEKWGYDLAEELYRPHITVTRFPGRPPGELARPAADLSFGIDRIGLFRVDRFGSTLELLDVFETATPGISASG
jgi:hypothetical protein